MRKLIAVLVLLGLAVGASACIHKQLIYSSYDLENFEAESLEERNIVYSGQIIEVTNYIGNISIIGQQEPDFVALNQYVSIEAVKRVRDVSFEELELEVEMDESEIVITASGPTDVGRHLKWTPPFVENRMAFFDLTIRVPRDAEVFIQQELGTISLIDMGSDESLGQIEVEQFAGDVTVANSNVEYLSIDQRYGDIDIANTLFDRGDLKTGVGNISIQFKREDSVRLTAKTSLREISLIGIANGDPGVTALMDTTWPGQELELQQWDGDARISIETGIGEILLEFIEP